MESLQMDRRTRLQQALRAQHKVMTLPTVRRILGGASDAALRNIIQYRGMPEPTRVDNMSRGQIIRSYVWGKQSWWHWYWRDRRAHKMLIESGGIGNISAEGVAEPKYQPISRDWIHGEAALRGRRLTHEITIGFQSGYGSQDEPSVVARLNEQEREWVGKLTKKLPTKVWRAFYNVSGAPRDMFLFCLTPENHGKLGVETRWHFHAELFLTQYEGRLLKRAMPTICRRVQKYLEEYADGRTVSVEMLPVNSGYAGYAQKDARNNLHMIESNFLDRRISTH